MKRFNLLFVLLFCVITLGISNTSFAQDKDTKKVIKQSFQQLKSESQKRIDELKKDKSNPNLDREAKRQTIIYQLSSDLLNNKEVYETLLNDLKVKGKPLESYVSEELANNTPKEDIENDIRFSMITYATNIYNKSGK